MKNRLILLLFCASLFVGPGAVSSEPVKKNRQYYEERKDIIWEVKTDQKLIALTFDDGPDPEETIEILDELKKYNAKCTFFVIGKRVVEYPDVAKRVVAEGHELANHTYNHVYFKKSSLLSEVMQELHQTETEIMKITGFKSTLFRPPGGIYNDNVVLAAKKLGLMPVLWSWHQDTRDWRKPGVNAIANRVLENARNGDIVLMHDQVYGHSQTVQALKKILPELTKRGFRVVTVTELINSDGARQVGK